MIFNILYYQIVEYGNNDTLVIGIQQHKREHNMVAHNGLNTQ